VDGKPPLGKGVVLVPGDGKGGGNNGQSAYVSSMEPGSNSDDSPMGRGALLFVGDFEDQVATSMLQSKTSRDLAGGSEMNYLSRELGNDSEAEIDNSRVLPSSDGYDGVGKNRQVVVVKSGKENGQGLSRATTGSSLNYSRGNTLRYVKISARIYENGPFTTEFNSIQLQDGSLFTGEISMNGKREGTGCQQWPDGTFYDGEWKGDKIHGKGTITHPNGDIYEGDWIAGKAHGKGRLRRRDGSIYEGEWFYDHKHGKGIEKWPDGSWYEGTFQDGKMSGNGEFRWANGNHYKGQFLKNNMHGIGNYEWNDGRLYSGSWRKNKMDGYGSFTWPDGRKYEGSFENDKRHGEGVIQLSNGSVYQGGWDRGRQSGYGIMRDALGRERVGEWSKGQILRWVEEEQDPTTNSVR